MTELKLEDVKRLGLEGLKYVKEVCDANGLKYYLAYGTLLGAVRHHGFIPWDDDVDLLMPRNDYEKFFEITTKSNNDNWDTLSFKNNAKYGFYWIKVCNKNTLIIPSRFTSGLIYGVSIDIFPLDYLRSTKVDDALKEIGEHRRGYNSIKRKILPINTVGTGKINLSKSLFKKVHYNIVGKHLFSLKKEYLKLEQSMTKNCTSKEYVGWILDHNYAANCAIWKPEWFDNGDGIETEMKFEDELFSVPYDFDSVLRTIYGDYMTPPPKEEQVTKHSYKVYYKE